jgi:acyl carrier protein
MATERGQILEELAEIVAEEAGLPVEVIQEDKSFADDLDVDSLSMMTIVTLAEERFDVRIPDEAVKDIATVGDAVDVIAAGNQA